MSLYMNKVNPVSGATTRKLKDVQFTLYTPTQYDQDDPPRLTIRTFHNQLGKTLEYRSDDQARSAQPMLRLSIKEARALQRFLNDTLGSPEPVRGLSNWSNGW